MDTNQELTISTIHNSVPGISKTIHRFAVGALFFVQGLSFASWASRIPTIQQKLHLSEAGLGGVLLALPIGLLVSLPLSGWLIAKLGSWKVLLPAAILYSLTLVGIGFSQNILQLLVCLLVFGFAGNMVNISVNTQAVGVESLYQKSIMASFHGLWSLAGFAGAAIGTYMIGQAIIPVHHFWFIAGINFLIIMLCARFLLKKDTNTHSNQSLFTWPEKSLINLGFIAFCAMMCEGTMFDWSGVYFKKVILAEKAWVGAGYTAFMCAMALSRFCADWFTYRFGLKRILQISGFLTASGLIIAVIFPHLISGIIGFLLVGAGVSSVVPLIYGAAGKSKVMSPGVALAAVSTIGFLGFLIGPPLIGFIADFSSLRISFAVIAVVGFCVTVIASKSNLEEGE